MNGSKNSNGLDTNIEHPHDHDVLSGRGNFVNYHAGNEYFRALVRKHKIAYVACPKPQKGKFSRMIVDEICNRTPPGRFLKQDHATKMWCEIGDKKALDKTRQALREGAPEILKEIDPEDENEEEVSRGLHSIHQQGFVGTRGFGVNNNSQDFASIDQSVIVGLQQQIPNMVPSSMAASSQQQQQEQHAAAQLQERLANRVVPGMLQIPGGTTQLSALRGSGLGNFAGAINSQDPYGVESFEPTPINPHAQIRVAEQSNQQRDRLAPAPQSRGLQRDNSLTFENLFAKDSASNSSAGGAKSNKRAMEGSSQHLSAMSFSIGDMTDASNLSAVFEDSMRISDDAAAESRYEKAKQVQQAQYSQAQHSQALSMSSDKRKPQAAHSSAHIDMSVASLGSLGLESSMMHMSFKSGFDEDSAKDGR